jgi:hypothetical protein
MTERYESEVQIMSNKNPNELVDRYLQAVRFWLPKNSQQEDLVSELGEDLRSQIEEKEAALGRPVNEAEVSEILKRCGAPMIVAGSMAPKRYLIGPAIYPIYIFVMKMVLLWVLVPVFFAIVAPVNVAHTQHWTDALAETVGNLWSAWLIAAGIITLVFAIVERTQAHTFAACKWDPLSLPPVQKTKRKPASRLHAASHLFFAVFGFVWLLLLPQHPFLILGPGAAMLQASPMVHRFYIPILLLAISAILRATITLAKPQWSWFPSLGELLHGIFALILLNFILKAGFPYLVLTAAAQNSAQAIRTAAIVNVSILLSLLGTWLGLSIATIIHMWKLLSYVRKRRAGMQQTASLTVR